jgi:hypothetical protein
MLQRKSVQVEWINKKGPKSQQLQRKTLKRETFKEGTKRGNFQGSPLVLVTRHRSLDSSESLVFGESLVAFSHGVNDRLP